MVLKEAKWIWAYVSQEKNEYCDFVDTFDCKSKAESILRISSDTNYEFYVNGKYVEFGQYGDFPEHKHYDEIDITGYTVPGLNVLAVKAYCHSLNSQVYVKGGHGVIFEVEHDGKTVLVSGKDTLSRVSPDYFSGDMYRFTSQLGYSFKYYGNKADDWVTGKQLHLKGFKPAAELSYTAKLSPRPIKKLIMQDDRSPTLLSQGVFKYADDYNARNSGDGKEVGVAVKMQRAYLSQRMLSDIGGPHLRPNFPAENGITLSSYDGDGIYLIIDLGAETAGSFTISLAVSEATKIDVGYGEHLDDLRCRTDIGGRFFAFEITTCAGRFDYTNNLKRIGARYIQLFVHSRHLTLYNVSIISTTYPVTVKDYTDTNYLRKRIYDTCVETLRLCMHEHYEDCPWREQALYSYDSRNQMLIGYYTFEEKEFPRANLVLLGRSLRDDGFLELCSPCRLYFTIPVFSAVYLLQVQDYIAYSGDREVLSEVIAPCRAILGKLLKNKTENGLIGNFTAPSYWNFYEWSEGLDGYEIFRDYEIEPTADMILSCFTACAIQAMETFTDDAAKKHQLKLERESLLRAIDKHFWDDKKQAYASFIRDGNRQHYSQYANAMALYAGVGSAERQDKVAQKLTAEDSGLSQCTLSAMFYMFEGLLKLDADRFLGFVMEKIDRDWGKMLFSGATAFYETAVGADDFGYAGSLCHGWSALPAYFYKKYIEKV